jgi:hypothetical protein
MAKAYALAQLPTTPAHTPPLGAHTMFPGGDPIFGMLQQQMQAMQQQIMSDMGGMMPPPPFAVRAVLLQRARASIIRCCSCDASERPRACTLSAVLPLPLPQVPPPGGYYQQQQHPAPAPSVEEVPHDYAAERASANSGHVRRGGGPIVEEPGELEVHVSCSAAPGHHLSG